MCPRTKIWDHAPFYDTSLVTNGPWTMCSIHDMVLTMLRMSWQRSCCPLHDLQYIGVGTYCRRDGSHKGRLIRELRPGTHRYGILCCNPLALFRSRNRKWMYDWCLQKDPIRSACQYRADLLRRPFWRKLSPQKLHKDDFNYTEGSYPPIGRWVAKLVARLLAMAALWVRIKISLKTTK